MTFNKYQFKKADKNYNQLFNLEKNKFLKIFPKKTKIEHVGSTAVPGLGGKGIIDILVESPKNKISSNIQKLESIGFVYKAKQGDNERKFLEKKIRYRFKERRIHVHLTQKNSVAWKEFILFRDYLKNNPKSIERYEQIKREALKQAKCDGKAYRKYKSAFIKGIIKQAKKGKQ